MTNYTLGGIVERSGIGLHNGIFTTVRVLPAAAGAGRYFVRVDLPGMPLIPARVESVCGTTLSTELASREGGMSKEPIPDQLPITNYQLPITHHQLPITNYQLPITNYSSGRCYCAHGGTSVSGTGG